ncbi:hypothetical protein ACMSIO_02820 [Pseudomonas benzopyrenica]|uniref:hypothetical protein n=1 Tax=Pseudomonas benzopyrenica TaxID=2993566 RepID=UPI0039C4E0BA
MNLENQENQENLLYRYLKSSHIKDSICWSKVCSAVEIENATPETFIHEAAFDLRPQEQDISFFNSTHKNETGRILDVLNELRFRRSGGGFSARSGVMKIDYITAQEDLNDIREVIRFEDNDRYVRSCRHFGLQIFASTDLDRLETVNALIELSSFFALKKTSGNPDKRDILQLTEQGKFFELAHNTPI